MKSLPNEPRITAYTLHVVYKVLKHIGFPLQFKLIQWEDQGPFKVTLAVQLANLTAYLLMHGLTGRYRDAKRRFLSKDSSIEELESLRLDQERKFSALKISEQAIAALFPSPRKLLSRAPGDALNRRNVRNDVLRRKECLKREEVLLRTEKLCPQCLEHFQNESVLDEFLERYEINYRACCGRYLVAKRKHKNLRRTVENEAPKLEEAITKLDENWRIPKDPRIDYALVDFGGADSILDRGIADLLRRYDPKWWGLFVTEVEKHINADVVKYPAKIMLRDPSLLSAAEGFLNLPKRGHSEGGSLTEVFLDPGKYNFNALFPKKVWSEPQFASLKWECRKADNETIKWLRKHGGENHPFDPFLLNRPSTEFVLAGRSRDVYLQELLSLLKRRHAV